MDDEFQYVDHMLVRHCWTISGTYFGYWEGDDLWSYQGQHVGRRFGDDIIGPNGWYLGSLMSCGRLAFNIRIAGMYRGSYIAWPSRPSIAPRASGNALPDIPSYDDFSRPEQFQRTRTRSQNTPQL
jgi:hypothetical protein